MKFLDLFKQKYKFIGLDIGPSSVKFAEVKKVGSGFEISRIGSISLGADVVQTATISQPSVVAEALSSLTSELDPKEYRGVFSIPAPSVFTKKARMQLTSFKSLKDNIEFEAASLIPHAISAVKLDFHVLKEVGKGQMEVLLVAVKNEVIDKFTDAVTLSGIDAGIADVEYFAIQGAFEANYPEKVEKTVALIEIGSKYAAVNIIKGGASLFCGDLNVGGNAISESLAEVFGMSISEAEKLKQLERVGDDRLREAALDILSKNVEHLATELNRQLSFFANAADLEGGVDLIVLSGGVAHTHGLAETVAEKTGIETIILDPFKKVALPSSMEETVKARASFAVSVGLALREFGDKIIPEFM